MVRKKNTEVPFSEAALRREKRANRNRYQLLYRLSKTEERYRLTRQTILLVNDFANYIAEQMDLNMNTTVQVKGVGVLSVVQWTSNIESKKVLVVGDRKDDLDERGHEPQCPGAAFGFDVKPGRSFFFNGDSSAQGRAASRDNYLSFALNIPQIFDAFTAEMDVEISRILSAFASLRHMVGSS